MTEIIDQSNGFESKKRCESIRTGKDLYNVDESIESLNFDPEILAIYKNHPHRPKNYRFEASDIPIFHFMHEFYCSTFKSKSFSREIKHGNLWGDELKKRSYTAININELFDNEDHDTIEHERESFIESEESSWSHTHVEPGADLVGGILEYLGNNGSN